MAEISIPYVLTTPLGDIEINPAAAGDGLYLTEEPRGLDGAAIRAETDERSQDDGWIIHPGFRAGMVVTLNGWVIAEAGTTARRALEDKLRDYTNRLLRPTPAELVLSCRLLWTPSGAAQRMLDKVQIRTEATIRGGYIKTFEITLHSPYGHTADAAESTQAYTAGATHTLTNGNVAVKPVVILTGPVTNATITNNTTGEHLNVTAAGVAGGHTLELDFFDRTAFVDGNGADKQSAIDYAAGATWFALGAADSITITGAAATVKWNVGHVG